MEGGSVAASAAVPVEVVFRKFVVLKNIVLSVLVILSLLIVSAAILCVEFASILCSRIVSLSKVCNFLYHTGYLIFVYGSSFVLNYDIYVSGDYDEVKGRHDILAVTNHQTVLDIPISMMLFNDIMDRGEFYRGIAKESLKFFPIIGPAILRFIVTVKRDNKDHDLRCLERSREKLGFSKQVLSLQLYPEGTRLPALHSKLFNASDEAWRNMGMLATRKCMAPRPGGFLKLVDVWKDKIHHILDVTIKYQLDNSEDPSGIRKITEFFDGRKVNVFIKLALIPLNDGVMSKEFLYGLFQKKEGFLTEGVIKRQDSPHEKTPNIQFYVGDNAFGKKAGLRFRKKAAKNIVATLLTTLLCIFMVGPELLLLFLGVSMCVGYLKLVLKYEIFD